VKKKGNLSVTEKELEVLFRNIQVSDENIIWDSKEQKHRHMYKTRAFLQMDRSDYAAFCSVSRKIRQLRRSMIHEDYHPF
jgi:hypothetical protein